MRHLVQSIESIELLSRIHLALGVRKALSARRRELRPEAKGWRVGRRPPLVFSVVGTSRYAPRAMRYVAKALIADR
jgi:hypothetical protein